MATSSPTELDFVTTTSDDSLPQSSSNQHLGKHRQYWRDIILGVNDGLVSTFLLVAGVAGAGLTTRDILLTALAGALAGAVSMAAGEYVATKSQNEVLNGEIKLEREHINLYHHKEMKELSNLLEVIGITREEIHLRELLHDYYEVRPEELLKLMIALEFGVIDEETRSPYTAAATSGLLFMLGCLPSVLPYIGTSQSPFYALIEAGTATALSLLVVGAVKTWATRGRWLVAAMENLIIAGFGGSLAYGVGVLFDFALN